MTWDPNQGQGQPGGGQDPYSGYGTPQNPYGAPQNPYGTPPPQNPYGTPPPENPYATPASGYQSSGYGAAYGIPPATPLPLGEALRQLPEQYIKVLTKPGAQTFAEEMGKADWGIVWVQLLIYAVIVAILSFLATLTNPQTVSTTTGSSSSINPATIQAFIAGASLFMIILIPVGFFIGVGIVYLFAKMFGGQGTFLQQAYTTLLFSVPIGIITSLLGLIPIVGTIGSLLGGIYSIVLNVFSVMAVHRLSGGKATAAVLLPVAIFLLLVCVGLIILVAVIAATVRQPTP